MSDPKANSVSTRMRFPAGIEAVWAGLMFYEQIEERPPWFLRLLLPVPIRTEGRKSEVGDEARCLYETGWLLKRVTGVERSEPARRYEFVVAEQHLAIGGGLRLQGGSYVLEAAGPGATTVTLTTNYLGPRLPRWAWRPIETQVCHVFHRHLLRAMRRKVIAHGAPQALTPAGR
ncbi:MAG: SRPBCC family protein [Planctomycetota bacterium]